MTPRRRGRAEEGAEAVVAFMEVAAAFMAAEDSEAAE